ncbi:hypothetical protein Moror_6278 [Moniliophthora roreri MCA 2997]|uniref:Uncharacterized protein n=1 Tax=Moniliophthora roreri (strain MCA 2997) TaxID=1381753 RepID=V2XTF7_MONRO|nr:hypothetical protein Moror_6278 [Moniliophthora roreri MCA 2997]
MTHPSSSSTRVLAGAAPGQLDPTQPIRLLRSNQSRLFFASFDPRTASSHRDPNLDHDLSKARRVILEANGEKITWRFVPKAFLEEGVIDEGEWPRVVDICGELFQCSQEQWDIYKLDPKYQCTVRPPPLLTSITLVQQPQVDENPQTNGKRPSSSLENPMPPLNRRKKLHNESSQTLKFTLSLSDDELAEESEVEEMIVDDGAPKRSRSAVPERSKKLEQMRQNREARREKAARRAEKLAQKESPTFEFSFPSTSAATAPTSQILPEAKRKATSLFSSLGRDDTDYIRPNDELYPSHNIYYEHTNTSNSKRARTVSPGAMKRELEAKRGRREWQKHIRREAKIKRRREQWNEQFMREVMAEVPEHGGFTNGMHADDDSSDEDSADVRLSDDSESEPPESRDPDESLDERAAREAAIAESRRKLAELEKDKPLWEAEARKRAMWEKAEEEAQRLREAQRRWEEARQAEAVKQARVNAAREREEAARREREQKAQRQREKYQRQQRWSYGPWTTQRALEKYKVMSQSFDTTKFSDEEPLTFDTVPWPVLKHPASLSVEDVDWSAVENFFQGVQPHMKSQDFRDLIEKSHRRFHPDRWRARGLLKTVANEAERGFLDVAANTVAQALTPLWMEVTGRK